LRKKTAVNFSVAAVFSSVKISNIIHVITVYKFLLFFQVCRVPACFQAKII